MSLVKMISGIYGLPSGGLIARKDRQSEPFEVSQAEAERIVGLGIAAYADISVSDTDNNAQINENPQNLSAVGCVETTEGNYTPEDKTPSQSENEGNFDEKPDFDENSPAPFLRSLGKQLGLTFPVGTTKAEMVAELNRYYADDDDKEPGSDVEDLI